MRQIDELRGIADVVYIVGRGESLRHLTAGYFGAGLVIALNRAIVKVRSLGLPNMVLSMQKDGNYKTPCNRDCYNCNLFGVDPGGSPLLVNWQSQDCFPDKDRIWMRDHAELGNTKLPSAVVAVRLAQFIGAQSIVMLCFDSVAGNYNGYDPVTDTTEYYQPYSNHWKLTEEALQGTKYHHVICG